MFFVFCFIFFGGYLGLTVGDPKYPAEKKTIANGVVGVHRTRVQTIRIYTQKKACAFGLLSGKSAKSKALLRNYLVLVWDQLWALALLDVGPEQSDLRIFA